MPRNKSAGRGSRYPKGVTSASTLAITSGGTIAEGGIEVASGTFLTWTELGYLNDAASNLNSISGIPVGHPSTAGYLISGGSVQWTGASVSINTGLTNIVTVIGSQGWLDSKVSAAAIDWEHNFSAGSGYVTVGLICDVTAAGVSYAGAATGAAGASSICWMAFGT